MSGESKSAVLVQRSTAILGFWLMGATAALLPAAVLLTAGVIPVERLGYVSSIIAFTAAFFAGFAAGRTGGGILKLLAVGVGLTLFLLLVGALLGKQGMDGSSILNTVSFTLSGTSAGFLLTSPGKKGRKRALHSRHVRPVRR